MNEIYDTHRRLSYQDMINRDERRFRVADHNRDGKATKDEFGDFLHPEDVSHMKDIVVEVSTNCYVWNQSIMSLSSFHGLD